MSTISPIIPYRDVRAAVDFLCEAFGFERHELHEGPDGELAHVELRYGDAVIMPTSVSFGAAGHAHTYVVVADADAHHDHAKASGAKITSELKDTDYGSRDYSAEDLDANAWSLRDVPSAGLNGRRGQSLMWASASIVWAFHSVGSSPSITSHCSWVWPSRS